MLVTPQIPSNGVLNILSSFLQFSFCLMKTTMLWLESKGSPPTFFGLGSSAPDKRTFIWLNSKAMQLVLRTVESARNTGLRSSEEKSRLQAGVTGEGFMG